MRKLIASFFVALLLAFIALSYKFYTILHDPFPANGSSTAQIIRLDKHASAASFVHELYRRNMIKFPRIVLLWIRVQGYASQLKAGVYEIKPGESLQDLLSHIIAGDVVVLPFRIIEGTTQRTIALQLSSSPYLIQQTDAWEKIAEGHPSAEGLLMADTYNYDADTMSGALLMTAHQSLMLFLQDAFDKRASDLPYKTPYELLIAASIIENEAADSDEQRLISGVIVNRLRQHMPLQMDPTVIYAMGPRFQGKLTHQDLSVDSPYNTYNHYGLPPTPIAMVGRAAIIAAAHPTPSKYLYYVATGDGRHHFSETYDQQRQAISKYNHSHLQ
jgi:UPF0755 protein